MAVLVGRLEVGAGGGLVRLEIMFCVLAKLGRARTDSDVGDRLKVADGIVAGIQADKRVLHAFDAKVDDVTAVKVQVRAAQAEKGIVMYMQSWS